MFYDRRVKRLEKYVQKYFVRHPEIRLVVVAGSVSKTSTKTAISKVLSERMRVRMRLAGDNVGLNVPLGIFGIYDYQAPKGFWSWHKIYKLVRRRIKTPTDVDVIVQELDAREPGDISRLASYLRPTLAVVTSVTPDNMDKMGSVDAIASEGLAAANFSQAALINRDDVNGEKYARFLLNPNIYTYGDTDAAEYSFMEEDFDVLKGYSGKFITPSHGQISANVHVVGIHNIRPVIAAVAVALQMGIPTDAIVSGVGKIYPLPGRLNVLRGANGSLILDDTYDSSPASAVAALSALYSISAPSRIAVFGDMNGLGGMAAKEHENLGLLCDSNMLSWVVTVGPESARTLAIAAQRKGCQVRSFMTAIEAGRFVRSVLEQDAVVLFKSSPDDIYLEESVKMILHSSSDESKLVRQSEEWLAKKREFFSKIQTNELE